MNRLKELRDDRNLSLRKAEELSNTGYSAINRYETYARDLSTEASKKFAEFYEVTIDYLLGYK